MQFAQVKLVLNISEFFFHLKGALDPFAREVNIGLLCRRRIPQKIGYHNRTVAVGTNLS